jgi:4-aminobutyrate aminotransferase
MANLYERDARSLSRLQNLRFFPLAATGGKGSYLINEDGRSLLDFSASWGAVSLGHSHPAVRAAVHEALGNQAGASTLSAANSYAVNLGERLLKQIPGEGDRRVWLGHSGSDANETVARLVVAATGKPRIISFSGAYHGGTAGSMAVSAHSTKEYTDKPDNLHVIPFPDPYRPFGGETSCSGIIDELQQSFENECPPNEVAALFIEPIQSDGGLIVPPQGFMKKLCDLCRSHGILLVSDEVKVGMGRSGLFNCIEHEDVTPDFVILGKGLGGGLPLSAVIGPTSLMNFATTFSMQTLHGNPVCAAAGLAVLDTMEEESLMKNATNMGGYLQSSLHSLAEHHEMAGDIRGRGLTVGLEFVSDRESKAPAARYAAKVVYRAFELGLILYYVGMNSNVLELTPPLNISAREVDEGVEILDQAMEDVTNGKVSDETIQQFEGW